MSGQFDMSRTRATPFPNARDGSNESAFSRMLTTDPGFIRRRQLRREEGNAIAEIRKAEIRTVREQVTALVKAATIQQCTEIRAEMTRAHSLGLTATVNEIQRDFGAIAQEQTAIANAASFVNLKAFADGRREIAQLAKDLPAQDEDLQAMLSELNSRLQERHAKTEARLEYASELAADLTNRNFLLGVAPAKFVIDQQ